MKHLNPRQGITTPTSARRASRRSPARVKHLNPRQGITTLPSHPPTEERLRLCETPKSPPGDYNDVNRPPGERRASFLPCETPKSPPGDYNRAMFSLLSGAARWCETPKSPPGDYNVQGGATDRHRNRRACETPKSPPGDYNEKRSRTDLRRRVRLV